MRLETTSMSRPQFSLAALFVFTTGAAMLLALCPLVYRVCSQIPANDWMTWSAVGGMCLAGLAIVIGILSRR